MSFLLKKLHKICNNGQYHLLGDAAYPIQPCLLTPYRRVGKLPRRKRRFNRKFCATRVVIENAFGILKQRFRQLQLLEFHKVDKINKFVITCCVLHNMCIFNDDIETFTDEIPEEKDKCGFVVTAITPSARIEKLRGEQKRNIICSETC